MQDQLYKNPLLHYLEHFHEIGIQPSQHFYNDYVRQTQKLSLDVDPLSFYLEQLRKLGDFRHNGFSPCPYFNRTYYLKSYPDIAGATEKGLDPFAHFSVNGHKEGRKGHPWLRYGHGAANEAVFANFSEIKRVAVLVLGMHRSGTSALTRVVNLLGLDIAGNLLPPFPTNPTGFWESDELRKIHDDLLAALGTSWDGFFPIDENKFYAKEIDPYRFLLKNHIVTEFRSSRSFVIKDPRMCRLMPLWLDILATLNIEVKIVIPFRNPLEVAQSLLERDGFLLEKSLLLWLRHIIDAERYTRKITRCFLSYTELLDNHPHAIRQIAGQCNLEWPNYSEATIQEVAAFIDAKYCHQHAATDEIPSWASQVYAILNELARNNNNTACIEELDNIAESANQANQLYGAILSDKETTIQQLRDSYRQNQSQIKQHTLQIQKLVENKL